MSRASRAAAPLTIQFAVEEIEPLKEPVIGYLPLELWERPAAAVAARLLSLSVESPAEGSWTPV